jgi:uncharacterized protein (DUF1778 family)
MARPPKDPETARTERLNLRLTVAERDQIDTAAARLGVTPTDYARRAALRYRLPPPRAQADPALIAQVRAVGVNLNQIARAYNSGAAPLPGELAEALRRISALLDRVQV